MPYTAWTGHIVLCGPFFGWKNLNPQREAQSYISHIRKDHDAAHIVRQQLFEMGGAHACHFVGESWQTIIYTQGRRKDGVPQDSFVLDLESFHLLYRFSPNEGFEFTGHGCMINDSCFVATEARIDNPLAGSLLSFRDIRDGKVMETLALSANVIHDIAMRDGFLYVTSKGWKSPLGLAGSGLTRVRLEDKHVDFFPAQTEHGCQHLALRGDAVYVSTTRRKLPADINAEDVQVRWAGGFPARRERENPRDRADVFLDSYLLQTSASELKSVAAVSGVNGHGVYYHPQQDILACTYEMEDKLVFYSARTGEVLKTLCGPQLGIYHPTAIDLSPCGNYLLVSGRYAHIAAIRVSDLSLASNDGIAIDTHELSHLLVRAL
jgi:hypothetical protein